jgi:uncharacterized protein (TIGR03086 family)
MMNPQSALHAAIADFQQVIDVAPIPDARHTDPTPCAGFTVEQLGEHMIDTHNLLLTGAGGQPVTRAGALGERHAAVAAAATAQWAGRGTAGTIAIGDNELPAAFVLSLHTLEAYIHGWDLATSLARPFQPSDELTAAMWSFAQDFITDDVRGDSDGAPYRAAVEAPSNASDLQRIIALSGRDPAWRRD